MSTEHFEDEVLTVEAAGRVLGISRSSAYEAVRTGELPAIRIGRIIRIPRRALERMLETPMTANVAIVEEPKVDLQ